MNIYVGNIAFKMKEEDLRAAFEAFGTVESARFVTDRETGRSKGFGFVEMPNEEEALAAINALNQTELFGRRLTVNEARPRGERNIGSPYGDRPRREAPSIERDVQRQRESPGDSIPEFLIPEATKNVWKNEAIDNFHLQLNTFTQYKDKKFVYGKNSTNRIEIPNEIKGFYSALKEETTAVFSAEIKLKTDSRLIVGIGEESIYETGITLHHIYGIPYIPGQAIKGVVRNSYIVENFEKDENKALKNSEFIEIFGDQKRAGKVVFYDSFPMHSFKPEMDIMNPHYGDYYSGTKPPADYLSPVLIPFLAVPKGVKFSFLLSMTQNHYKEEIMEKAKNLTLKALTEHGIGAKTAVGYGYFKEA
ncbi:MAG: type III-B CRISPR module RAMP protein Cmr6 [bacterium]